MPDPRRVVAAGVAVCRRAGLDTAAAAATVEQCATAAARAATAAGQADVAWLRAIAAIARLRAAKARQSPTEQEACEHASTGRTDRQ